MFKGLNWSDLPKKNHKRKRGKNKDKRWLINTIRMLFLFKNFLDFNK